MGCASSSDSNVSECTLQKENMVLLAFDLYDKDSSGSLEASEVRNMFNDVFGKDRKWFTGIHHSHLAQGENPIAKEMEGELEAIAKLRGRLNIDDFKAFISLHPRLLHPLFRLQQSVFEQSGRRLDGGPQQAPAGLTCFNKLKVNKSWKRAVKNNDLNTRFNGKLKTHKEVEAIRRRSKAHESALQAVAKYSVEASQDEVDPLNSTGIRGGSKAHERALQVVAKYSVEASQDAHTYIYSYIGRRERKIGCRGEP
jgi:hypothetical protein